MHYMIYFGKIKQTNLRYIVRNIQELSNKRRSLYYMWCALWSVGYAIPFLTSSVRFINLYLPEALHWIEY